MSTESIVERIVASSCDSAIGVLARWADATIVARRIREHAILLLGDPRSVARASGHGGDRGERAEIVEWGADSFALVQPRSSAESRTFPHAIAWYCSPEPRDRDDAMALCAATVNHFADPELAAVCIFRHGPASPPEPLATPYKRWVAGAIRELMDAPTPRGYERVRVRRPADLSFYPAYQRMYEAFWEAEPQLGQRIGMEEPEQFLSHAADDGLRLVEVDGELGGVIGAFRHEEVGLRGWRIEERVMHERYRGQGLAAAALRRFVEDLPGQVESEGVDGGETLIWGTILVQHAASLGSALRLGRVDVGGLWWLDREDPVARWLG